MNPLGNLFGLLQTNPGYPVQQVTQYGIDQQNIYNQQNVYAQQNQYGIDQKAYYNQLLGLGKGTLSDLKGGNLSDALWNYKVAIKDNTSIMNPKSVKNQVSNIIWLNNRIDEVSFKL